MPSKKIIIAGTHHTPAIELIKQLNQDNDFDWIIHYVAHLNPAETHLSHTIIPKLGVIFHALDSGKYDRRSLLSTSIGIPKILLAVIRSYFLTRQIRPDIVVSFGGYVSVPIIISASLNGIPCITHEQTRTISLSTKINSLLTTKVALTFDNSVPRSNNNKFVITGNLIRSEIFETKSRLFSHLTPRLTKFPLLYITGGNQGSAAINQLVLQSLPNLLKRYTIIFQTGKVDLTHILKSTGKTNQGLMINDYINSEDIGWVLHHAAVIVSRSGANITQEIAILQKPAVLIPHPYTQQNEQQLNATWLKSQQPTKIIILDQMTTTPPILIKSIDQLIGHRSPPIKVPYQNNLRLLSLIHELL